MKRQRAGTTPKFPAADLEKLAFPRVRGRTVRAVPDLLLTEYTADSPLRHPLTLLRALGNDLLAGRELAWRLFVRDLSAQYRQTYFGYAWALLPPLVAAATFIFLQAQGILKVEGTGIAYPAFAAIGTLLWQTFVDAMQSPITAVQSAKSMLAKVNFPREAILLGGLYLVAFNFLLRLVPLGLILCHWAIAPAASLIVFPFVMGGLLLAGFAVGMMMVPLGGLYGDVGRALPLVAQFWMLLTPVIYPARATGGLARLIAWNPIAPLLTTARDALTGQAMTQLPAAVAVTAGAAALALLGLVAFRLVLPFLIERAGG